MDPLILFIIVGSIAGFLLGAVVGLFIARRGENRKSEEESASIEQGLSEPDQPLVEPPAQLTKRAREDYQPLICLWRGRESGELAIEVKGKLYPSLNDFDRNAHASLFKLNQEWMGWLGISTERSQGVETQAAAQEKVSIPEKKEPTPAVTTPPADKPASTPKKDEIIGSETDELRSKTMVEQIDEILQEKLSRSPHANQSIRIMEDPGKGVVVWIGLKHYSGIDEVDDPEVLKIIQAAVVEWETRTQGKRR